MQFFSFFFLPHFYPFCLKMRKKVEKNKKAYFRASELAPICWSKYTTHITPNPNHKMPCHWFWCEPFLSIQNAISGCHFVYFYWPLLDYFSPNFILIVIKCCFGKQLIFLITLNYNCFNLWKKVLIPSIFWVWWIYQKFYIGTV